MQMCPRTYSSATSPNPTHSRTGAPSCPFLSAPQIYPRTFLGDQSMYDKSGWQLLVRGWEAAVYNPGALAREGGKGTCA